MITVDEKCNECDRHPVCRFINQYEACAERLTSEMEDMVAYQECQPNITIQCRYFKSIKELYRKGNGINLYGD